MRTSPQEFRAVLGNYATGVAVVSCRDRMGRSAAMTINSFASLSLNPPLVLWSIDKECDQAPFFAEATHYAINILAEGQRALSVHFATPSQDKFCGIEHEAGLEDIPLLPGCCAILQCQIVDRYEAGDHVILIGEVLDMRRTDAKPLVVHAGQYCSLA
ncbi:flavin reductase family protein [Novosphingobium endophyticum]|nr:flavin reductase family protein [Novosphingobium endophyticum]